MLAPSAATRLSLDIFHYLLKLEGAPARQEDDDIDAAAMPRFTLHVSHQGASAGASRGPALAPR